MAGQSDVSGSVRSLPLRRYSKPIGRLKTEPMFRNSIYLALAVSTMSFLGFLSWLVIAHLYSPSAIGRATSLITAMSLISYISLFGLNSTLIRFLPSESAPEALINSALTLCGLVAIIVGSCYVLSLPLVTPELDFVRRNPFYAAAFVLLTACSAVNLLTDSVFIAFREAKYNVIIDGVIQGLTKLGLPVVLLSLGSFGIFASSGIAACLAVLASIYYIHKLFRYRFSPVIHVQVMRSSLKFSVGNYVSSILNILPLLVVPIIILDRIGTAAAGYYYVAFQLAILLYALSFSVSESMLAEGSRRGANLARLARRSIVVIAIVSMAGGATVVLGRHLILGLFGGAYSSHAATALVALAIGAPANGLNAWASNLLKITKQLSVMIISNVFYTLVIVGSAWFLAERGIGAIALSWMYGNLVSGGIAAVAVLISWRRHIRRPVNSHRRATEYFGTPSDSLPGESEKTKEYGLLAPHRGSHTKHVDR